VLVLWQPKGFQQKKPSELRPDKLVSDLEGAGVFRSAKAKVSVLKR
jgi:hypothetical protein